MQLLQKGGYTKMIKIKNDVYNMIVQHAEKDSPIEACGYLAGKDNVVSKHYELTNIDNSSEHYSLDPKEQFQIIRNARSDGLEILAVYHSHPKTPARMSQEDIKLAYDPHISYVIISLADGVDIKSFKIKNNNSEIEQLEVINE